MKRRWVKRSPPEKKKKQEWSRAFPLIVRRLSIAYSKKRAAVCSPLSSSADAISAFPRPRSFKRRRRGFGILFFAS